LAVIAVLPNVRVDLCNSAENVLLVREMLTGVAETVSIDGKELDHIRTAVTEACNNVVLHAYEGASGPLEVEVYLRAAAAIEVVVRDHGIGTRARPPAVDDTPVGLGLSVIEALVHHVEFKDPPGGGTEVRMEFAVAGARELEPIGGDGTGIPEAAHAHPVTTTTLAMGPPELAGNVLARVLTVLAAHANFGTDRIFEVQTLADTLIDGACGSWCAPHLTVAVSLAPHELGLRIGPLDENDARRLSADATGDCLGGLIEAPTDDQRAAINGAHEMLALRLVDRPAIAAMRST
jgi:serine/threonine-protein kinase RsbW